jgi:UDP-N-acetylmuramoyl-tripeptide--D-alanyl-D-alanine ligase
MNFERFWSPQNLSQVTDGSWEDVPSEFASGICVTPNTQRPFDLVAVRGPADTRGVSIKKLASLEHKPFALMANKHLVSQLQQRLRAPILKVDNVETAIMKMANYSRELFSGRVIGVTGSAGKTSVTQMLATTLSGFGNTFSTRANANLPGGIAWNLASIPWQGDFAVIEMAIGRMRQNSELVHPTVALFTNIGPAHLQYHGNVKEVAIRKARIFESMPSSGLAVLNSDMDFYDVVLRKAEEQGLTIVSYGKKDFSTIKFLHLSDSGEVTVRVNQDIHKYFLDLPSSKNVYNTMACLAAAHSLGLDIERATSHLAGQTGIEGRGQIIDVKITEGHIRIIDESYNANPISMSSALEASSFVSPPKTSGRRVYVLGDMLELGESSRFHHDAIDKDLETLKVDHLILCGPEMLSLYGRVKDFIPTEWVESVDALLESQANFLEDGDLLFVKGSGGTGLSNLVSSLVDRSEIK